MIFAPFLWNLNVFFPQFHEQWTQNMWPYVHWARYCNGVLDWHQPLRSKWCCVSPVRGGNNWPLLGVCAVVRDLVQMQWWRGDYSLSSFVTLNENVTGVVIKTLSSQPYFILNHNETCYMELLIFMFLHPSSTQGLSICFVKEYQQNIYIYLLQINITDEATVFGCEAYLLFYTKK